MSRKSTQIALGGLFSALCLVLMFMTGLIPFSMYVIPALAGAMLIPVIVEIGPKTAVLVYVTVSLLSVFIAPDREASMIFIVFFGYYPIIKPKLESLRLKILQIACKYTLFNASVILGYLAVAYLFGMPGILDDMGDLGRYGALILLVVANFTFILYDFLLTRYTFLYIRWFKPTFLKR